MKKFKKFKSPFKYILLDNFIESETFDKLKNQIFSLKLVLDKQNRDFRTIIRFSKDGKIIDSEGVTLDVFKEIFEQINQDSLEMLKNLAPKKLSLYDYSEIRIQKAPKFYDSGPHTDSTQKLLSTVTYIYPKKGEGTFLHKGNNQRVFSQIEWKENRCFAFSRIENKTWHSWRSNSQNGRFTLIYTLLTNKPNKALFKEGFISVFFYYLELTKHKILKPALKSILKSIFNTFS